MNQQLWTLSRATGIVATVLAAAALTSGFLFSARATGNRRRPAWWLDLHNWLGGLALAFTAAHIVTSWLDTNAGIGLVRIVVPGTADANGWSITWGVLSTYLFAAVVFTTWPRRMTNRRTWRVVHLTSVAATALAFVHAYQIGTDALRTSFRAGIVVLVAGMTYSLGIQVFGRLARPARDSQPGHS